MADDPRPAALEDRYFDLPALSAYCGLSVRTLQRFLSDPVNPLPNFYVQRSATDRGRILVSKRAFDEWMARFPPMTGHGRAKPAKVAAAARSGAEWAERLLKGGRK